MKHLALYRKYRPRSFKEIAGQKAIITTLRNVVKNQCINHAYIFCGSKGIGKTSIAKIFAKNINCLDPQDGEACGVCANCLAINQANVIDILEIDAASNNGVEEIRGIIDGSKYLPTQLKKKVYIIDEAHMLSNGAWNALLKTIEEPANHLVFIFATTEMNKIPETIKSRCQYFNFENFSLEQIKQLLTDVAQKEKIAIDEIALNKIAMLANGAARDALSKLDQLASMTNKQITVQDVNEIFGLMNNDQIIDFINHILDADQPYWLKMYNEFVNQGINLINFIDGILNITVDQLTYLNTNEPKLLRTTNLAELKLLNNDQTKLIKFAQSLQNSYLQIKNSNHPFFYFELVILGWIEDLKKPNKQTDEQPITNAKPAPSKPAEPIIPKPAISKKTFAPKIDHDSPFTFEEIIIDKAKNKTILQMQTNQPSINIDETIKQIIFNNDPTQLAVMETKIKTDLPKELALLKKVGKILSVSKNGMVVVYRNKIDVDLLNTKFFEPDFLTTVNNFFGKPLYIVACSIDQARTLIEYYNQHATVKYPEPNVNQLDTMQDHLIADALAEFKNKH